MVYELAVVAPQSIEGAAEQQLRVELGTFCSPVCLCVHTGAVEVEDEE